MAVRIKEGMIPYKWGDWIEITNNHIINVLLREANNLIHMNENRELYVDLQLDDGIQPDDDFPVGVTTGKILQEDWRQQNWLILNWKTTSGDYARLIYANDWNLYVDLWDWVWRLLGWGWADFWNVKAFYVDNLSETTVWQAVVDWYLAWKYPIVIYNDESYILEASPTGRQIRFYWIHTIVNHYINRWYSNISRKDIYASWDTNWVFQWWMDDEITISPNVLATDQDYTTIYTPQYNWSPATKKYVDDGLALKQDILTAWNNITIQNNVISANLTNVYTYKWSVPTVNDLPTSWQNVWDVWEAQDTGISYAWNGTSWINMWTTYNLSDYFNKVQDDSDDITEWSVHLFCSSIEKNYWNSKQDALTAWNGIDITNNVISARYTAWNNISIDNNYAINNDAPFEPDNAWSMGQILQKTSNGYEWRSPNFVTSVNWQTWAVTVDEFEPQTQGSTGQILQKTANGYDWVNNTATQYIAWSWINVNQSTREISNTLPFNPDNTWSTWQVLKKTASGYSWQNESWWGWGWGWGTTYYGWDYITIDGNHYINNTAPFTPASWTGTTGQVLTKTSGGYQWANVELPSGENNVKFWTLNSNATPQDYATQQEIWEWLDADVNNWAIINDTGTNDVFVFYKFDTYGRAVFYGTKRNSIAQESIVQWVSKWYYTKQWQNELDIYDSTASYGLTVRENPDDATHTNYISALPVWYQSYFEPREDYQPATKGYVDNAITWWWIPYTAWNGISISNHVISNTWILPVTTWTTSSCTGIWVGTASEYSALQNKSNSVLYVVFPTS